MEIEFFKIKKILDLGYPEEIEEIVAVPVLPDPITVDMDWFELLEQLKKQIEEIGFPETTRPIRPFPFDPYQPIPVPIINPYRPYSPTTGDPFPWVYPTYPTIGDQPYRQIWYTTQTNTSDVKLSPPISISGT